MANQNQVYQKFGEVSEAAQLLETQLGNMLLLIDGIEQDLLINIDKGKAGELLNKINKSTLGQLIKRYNNSSSIKADEVWDLLEDALAARNRLTHSFYRSHNMRIHSDDGRNIMLSDLEELHSKILLAYTKLMLIQGIDLHKMNITPTGGHLQIE